MMLPGFRSRWVTPLRCALSSALAIWVPYCSTCGGWQRPLFQPLGQRLSFQVFHDDEINAVLPADVVQRADVGMIQAGNNFGLALEALTAGRIVGEMRRKNLDGDGTVETRIPRPIDFPHSTRAQAARRSRRDPVWCHSPRPWMQRIIGPQEAPAKCIWNRTQACGNSLRAPTVARLRRADQCFAVVVHRFLFKDLFRIRVCFEGSLPSNGQTGVWPIPVRRRSGQVVHHEISDGRIRANNRDVFFHP